jgi:YfdX protein
MDIARAIVIGTAFATIAGVAQAAPAKPIAETTMQKTTSPASTAAQDETKLSKDGAEAFRDLQMARMAIYEANPDLAKKSINEASDAMAKAQSDSTAFIKAEADLKTRPGAKEAKSDTTTKPSATPIAWLPIDGELTLGENFVATPEKAAAVAEANKRLSAGDRKTAIEKLKLANVDVFFTIAVVPLEQTVTEIAKARELIDGGKYYEANAVMKKATDSVRYDTVAAQATPQATDSSKPASPAKE